MTNVLTDKQKKISAEIGLTLQHAAVVAQRLVGLGRHSDALIATINAAMERLERVGSEVVSTIQITQRANGSWAICAGDAETEAEERDNLTASAVLDEITRMVMAACPLVAEPIADTQQATEAEFAAGPATPDESQWLRVRAMELAISANQGRQIDAVMAAAKQIETFLKRGA